MNTNLLLKYQKHNSQLNQIRKTTEIINAEKIKKATLKTAPANQAILRAATLHKKTARTTPENYKTSH
jgi:hypothetical protein